MSVLIKYGDIALGAKEKFSIQPIEQAVFSDITQIQKNVSIPNYQNVFDEYSVPLDGSALPLPSEMVNIPIGFWSKQKSNENGIFESPISIEFTASEYFISPGISLVFDVANGVYPTDVSIYWYRDGEQIEMETFTPNSASYFFNKKVEYYNGLKIEFRSINMPLNRLKIKSLEYGLGAEFTGKELKSVKLKQQLNQISSEIAINTCDFVISPRTDTEFSFQNRQPCEIYSNGNLVMVSFIKDFKKSNQKDFQIQSEDYIGIMEDVPYYGGIYSNKNAYELLEDIFNTARVPFSIDDIYKNSVVSGYIKYTNCREALMQVCFAISAAVDTSFVDVVKVFPLSESVSQTIEKRRIFKDQKENKKTRITSVELVSHAYLPISETLEAYNSSESGEGEDVFVVFNEPLHNLEITNGTIKQQGANFAIIDAYDGCVLIGRKYEHTTITKSKKNPLVTSTDKENIVSIQNATLVSKHNVDNLLNSCYNYLANKNQKNLKIVDGKKVTRGTRIKYGMKKYGSFTYGAYTDDLIEDDVPCKVGDLVEIPLDNIKTVTMRIVEQSFSLVGGITVKDTVLE